MRWLTNRLQTILCLHAHTTIGYRVNPRNTKVRCIRLWSSLWHYTTRPTASSSARRPHLNSTAGKCYFCRTKHSHCLLFAMKSHAHVCTDQWDYRRTMHAIDVFLRALPVVKLFHCNLMGCSLCLNMQLNILFSPHRCIYTARRRKLIQLLGHIVLNLSYCDYT